LSLLVVDASVAAKWLLPRTHEPLADEATYLLERYSKGELRFAVPDIFWAELGNVLWKAVRLKRCSQARAREGLAALGKQRLATVSSSSLLDVAFGIAVTFDRTVYDSLHVALAVTSKGQLVTADEKLADSLATHFPVKWLGAFAI
jgi:predicted nucleic acid-binding protein